MQKYLLSDFYFAVNGAGFKRRKSILLNNSDIDFYFGGDYRTRTGHLNTASVAL